MNWTIAKFAAAGVLTVMPIAAVGMPAGAIASSGSTHSVLPAPPPADPPTDAPAPAPAQHHGEYYNPNDYNDWWISSAGGGGGGA